jgi:hypothetical protein
MDWHRTPAGTVVDEHGHTSPLAPLDVLGQRFRTRQYSSRTEVSYADWVRRFLVYVAERQGVPHPRVESAAVRDPHPAGQANAPASSIRRTATDGLL